MFFFDNQRRHVGVSFATSISPAELYVNVVHFNKMILYEYAYYDAYKNHTIYYDTIDNKIDILFIYSQNFQSKPRIYTHVFIWCLSRSTYGICTLKAEANKCDTICPKNIRNGLRKITNYFIYIYKSYYYYYYLFN